MKYLRFLLSFIILYSCANSETEQTLNNRSFVFVACEANFGASNGSIHIIDEKEKLHQSMTLEMLFNLWKFLITNYL